MYLKLRLSGLIFLLPLRQNASKFNFIGGGQNHIWSTSFQKQCPNPHIVLRTVFIGTKAVVDSGSNENSSQWGLWITHNRKIVSGNTDFFFFFLNPVFFFFWFLEFYNKSGSSTATCGSELTSWTLLHGYYSCRRNVFWPEAPTPTLPHCANLQQNNQSLMSYMM